jgi:DNA-binding beta-propeller fold protein YncE
MAIYRGPGGSPASSTDATLNAVTEKANEAATSAQNAATSETNAATSATAAAGSATTASNAAQTAIDSIGSATADANAAAASASQAATSASNATSSENSAATSATNSGTSATASANSATASATSATNSANSATASSGSATQAATSATSSATSATASAGSATASASSATAAASSATSAANSEAGVAASATAAANSATASATSATASANSATSSAASAASAAASYDDFDDRYLGAKSSDPSVDNDGGALITGALYFNTTSNTMKVYSGSSWGDPLAPSVTKATQSKSYTTNEVSSITLSQGITSGVPVVSVTKEIPQTGLTNNNWDVDSDGANYDFENSAYSTTLTPSEASADGVFTLGSGSFDAADVGKIVSGNGGTAVIIKTDGSYNLLTNFTNTSAIASGSWTLKELVVDGDATGIALSSGTDEEGGVVYDFRNAVYTGASFSVASQEIAPNGLAFNNDGTKMYVIGQLADSVFQYSLSTAFDLSTASYDSVSFSVASQDAQPQGLAFNTDGSKMYVVGGSNDSVFQYSLSTGFDLSTASYDSVSFSVASQDIYPQGVAFNTDGTKMYMIGQSVQAGIYQYTLSTAFDLSTASYDSVFFNVSNQSAYPTGLTFNTDGTKMYVVGFDNDEVYQYTLSTAFNVSTASYDSVSFSIASQDTTPTGLAFNNDGSKMYVIGQVTDSVYQYSLDPRFNLKAADYMGNSFSVASQDTLPQGLAFNNDGTKMYILGDTNNSVFQYTLSTAFDVTTASYASKSFSVGSQDPDPLGLVFNTDGTKMYIIGDEYNSVFQYSLSTAFDVSTASYASLSFSVNSQDTNPHGLAFNNDGTKMYVVGNSTDSVHQYTLSTAFNVSTASYASKSFSFSSQDSQPTGLVFNSNGTEMYITGNANNSVFKYTLSTAFDVSTASYDSVSFSVASQEASPHGLRFNTDGSKMYVVGNTDSVYEYEMGGAFSLKTVEYTGDSFSVASQEVLPQAVAFNNDGTKMYVVGYNIDSVFQYSLSTGFDISTASYDSVSFSIASQETTPRSMAFNNDGTKMYIVGNVTDTVFQYTLSTAFDLSTASYASKSFSVASQDTIPFGLAFSTDGTKMYIFGAGSNSVYQYSLSTAFDVSTASYDNVSFSVNSQDTGPRNIAFNNDGTKMYIVGYANISVYQYTLSTGFNLSTASYDNVSLSVASQDTQPEGVAFNNDGTKMYVIGLTNDKVHQYNVGSTLVQIPVVYSSDYAVAVTNSGGQIDTTYWVDINSTTATEVVGTGEVYYAYSTDDHVTWKVIHNTTGQRSIVRDNSGTWQYNSNATYGSETWANATTNTEFAALRQAFSVAANQMDGAQLDAVTDPNHLTLENSLDFMIALKNADSTSTSPTSDGVELNYDSQSLNRAAILGTDYNWDFPASNVVQLTSLGNYNFKVRVV